MNSIGIGVLTRRAATAVSRRASLLALSAASLGLVATTRPMYRRLSPVLRVADDV